MNYLSKPYAVEAPVDMGGNLQLAIGVANNLQTRYDANKAIIDQTISQYEGLRGLTELDNQYIASQVSNIKNQVNKLGSLNLAHNTGRDTILNNMKNVLKDPIVQDILVSKNNYDAYNAEASKIKEKNPEKYSDANYQYGLYKGGYENYIQGKTKKLGSMSFVPQGDPQKELRDIAENIEKYDTEIKRVSTENGYIYTQEGKVITEDKLRNIAETFLTDEAKKQLVINGWASIHQGNTEEERVTNTKRAFEGYSSTILADEKKKLDLYIAEAKKTGLDEDKNNVKTAQENYSNTEKRLKDIATYGSPEQMYGTVYAGKTIDNFSKTFAYNTVSLSNIQGDTTQMARERMAFDTERAKIKDAQWKADYDLKVSGGGGAGAYMTKADFGAEVPESGNVQQQAITEIDSLNTIITEKADALYNSLDEETKKGIDLEIQESKGLKTREDVLIEYSKNGIISNSDAKNMSSLVNQRYVKQSEYNKYRDEAEKEANIALDSPEMISRLYDNPNIKIVWKGKDGKDHLYSAKDILTINGIVNEKGEKLKNLQNVTPVFEAIKKSMMADKALSASHINEYEKYLKQLATASGENFEDITTVKKPSDISNYIDVIGLKYSNQVPVYLKTNSKTAQVLLEHRKKGGYNKAGIFSADDSFDDIPEVDEYFTKVDPSIINKKIGDKIMANSKTTFGLVTTVMPDTSDYKQLAQQAGFEITGKVPIEIKQVKGQPNMVTISLGKGSATKNAPTETANIETIRIEDLPATTLKQVNLYNTKATFSLDNFPSMKQKATFTNRDGALLTGFAKTFYGGTDRASVYRASLTTVRGATDFYFTQFANQLGTIEKPTPLGQAVQNMIKSPDTYVETQKTKNTDGTFIIPIITKGGSPVYIPNPTVEEGLVDENNTDSTYEQIKFNPQKYINDYLTSVLQSENKNQIDKLIKVYGQ